MTFLAILTVRNEAAFLLEWLAHHRAVGFTDFLVFSNDCQDGTDVMLDRLAEMGELTHLRNEGPYDARGIQFTALKKAEKLKPVQRADWILTLDVDEFVNIHTGQGTLPDLLTALPDATAITLTWRLFGNGGVIDYEDRPILDTFTRCAPEVMYWPWRSTMFKTLYRNDGIYRKVGVHRPRSPREDRLEQARWFDGEGRELGGTFKTQRLFSDFGQKNYGLVQLNHYPLGAMESYIVKADRGKVNRSAQPLNMDYWVERNFNVETDASVQRMRPLSQPHLDRYHADETLGGLHRDAVAWRQERFKTLMLEEHNRALFGRLLLAQPTKPLPVELARRMVRYGYQARARTSD